MPAKLSLICTLSSSLIVFRNGNILTIYGPLEAVDLLTLNTTASKNDLTSYIINWRIFVYILSAY